MLVSPDVLPCIGRRRKSYYSMLSIDAKVRVSLLIPDKRDVMLLGSIRTRATFNSVVWVVLHVRYTIVENACGKIRKNTVNCTVVLDRTVPCTVNAQGAHVTTRSFEFLPRLLLRFAFLHVPFRAV